MTDKQLYKLCKKFGRRALEAKRKFGGLLPEVLRRRLYEKKGFGSIYEFAAKLSGMSRDQVDDVLRLDRRFEDKPILRRALVSGEISPNKLIRIASIATVENQSELFEAVKKYSRRAMDIFVKDYRAAGETKIGTGSSAENGQQDGLFKANNELNSLSGQTFEPDMKTFAPVSFDYEIVSKLSPEVKNKIKEMMDKGLDINKELMEFFEERENKILHEKLQIAHEEAAKTKKEKPSRHIPAKIKKIIKKQYGEKCANPDCKNTAENLHHTRRFAITKSHDPRFLQPLCKAHHEIKHADDIFFQKHGWESG